MENNKKKQLSILIIGVILVTSLTACSNKSDNKDKTEETQTKQETQVTAENTEAGDKSEDEDNTSPYIGKIILSVDDEKVSYSEVMIYFKYIQSYYENIFGETIWNYDLGDKTIGDLAKQDVIDTIVERKIAKSKWDDYSIIITEEDEDKVKEDSRNYLKGITKDDIDYYGFTEEVAYQFFFDNLMAERVYDATTMNVDTNVSDEEAKQITIQYILVTTKKTDSTGQEVSISEEDKKVAYAEAQQLLIEASNTEDFGAFAKSSSDSAQIETTFGKGDLEQAIEDAAFALKTGETSNIIEGDPGYYILYCVRDYNEDATLEKKEEIIDERQAKEFESLFQEWQKDAKVKINDGLWNKIKFE